MQRVRMIKKRIPSARVLLTMKLKKRAIEQLLPYTTAEEEQHYLQELMIYHKAIDLVVDQRINTIEDLAYYFNYVRKFGTLEWTSATNPGVRQHHPFTKDVRITTNGHETLGGNRETLTRQSKTLGGNGETSSPISRRVKWDCPYWKSKPTKNWPIRIILTKKNNANSIMATPVGAK